MAVSMMKEWQGKIINVESIVMDEDTTPLAEANRKWRLVWKRKVMPIIQRNISPIFCMLFKKQKIQTTRVQKQYHILKSVSTTSLPWTEKILQIKKKNLKSLTPYIYGDHSNCRENCACVRNLNTYIPKNLPYSKYLSDRRPSREAGQPRKFPSKWEFQQHSSCLSSKTPALVRVRELLQLLPKRTWD